MPAQQGAGGKELRTGDTGNAGSGQLPTRALLLDATPRVPPAGCLRVSVLSALFTDDKIDFAKWRSIQLTALCIMRELGVLWYPPVLADSLREKDRVPPTISAVYNASKQSSSEELRGNLFWKRTRKTACVNLSNPVEEELTRVPCIYGRSESTRELYAWRLWNSRGGSAGTGRLSQCE